MPDVQYPDDPASNPSTIRIEDLLATDEGPQSATEPPVREGLPRSFRMRADKHYVEMLDAPQGRPEVRRGAESAKVAVPDAAVERANPAEALATRAGQDLAQSLAALRTCTNLLSDRSPALASAVAANLIRAEVWRATCLHQSSRFLRGEITPTPKPVAVQAIVDQVVAAVEPERRLRCISVEQRVTLGESSVVVDEELMVAALSGLVLATAALQEEQSPLTVTLTAVTQGSEVVLSVSQTQVRASSHWAADALPVTSAARIVAASEGRLAVSMASGTDVRVTLPRAR